jgi:hypothetical protein
LIVDNIDKFVARAISKYYEMNGYGSDYKFHKAPC